MSLNPKILVNTSISSLVSLLPLFPIVVIIACMAINVVLLAIFKMVSLSALVNEGSFLTPVTSSSDFLVRNPFSRLKVLPWMVLHG